MTQVTILGPNLRDQSKGTFHVHRAGCGDIARRYDGEEQITIDAEDPIIDVVAFFYTDQLGDHGLTAESPEGICMLNDWASDFWWAPCVTL